MPQVTVVGAGVVGLTSAVALLEAGHEVTVVADRLWQHTTSVGAGAIWFPVYCGDGPDIDRWAVATLERLKTLPARLVRERSGVQLYVDPAPERPSWAGALPAFRRLSREELARWGPEFGGGFRFTSLVVDSPRYLAHLAARVEALGGRVLEGRVAALTDCGTNVVVNCAGLGARELTGDAELSPGRGQTVRVFCPALEEFLVVVEGPRAVTYALPRQSGAVVLGGTHQEGDERERSDKADADAILRRVGTFLPEVAAAPELARWAGLRPERPSGPLVASEVVGQQLIVHNYGHGGSGMTLHWGCADAVVEMVGGARL